MGTVMPGADKCRLIHWTLSSHILRRAEREIERNENGKEGPDSRADSLAGGLPFSGPSCMTGLGADPVSRG